MLARRLGPAGAGGQREDEGRRPAVGDLLHVETEREQFIAVGGPAAEFVGAGRIGERGGRVDDEGRFEERIVVLVQAAPQKKRCRRAR